MGICTGACLTPLLKSGPHTRSQASRKAGVGWRKVHKDRVLSLTRLLCWAEVGVVSSGHSTCSHTAGEGGVGEKR